MSAETLRLDWVQNGLPRAALDLISDRIFGVAATAKWGCMKCSEDNMTLSSQWHLLQKALLSAMQATMQLTLDSPQDGFKRQCIVTSQF